MSDFRFVIPLKLGDLKNPTNRLDQYVVSLDYTPREISEKLNECNEKFRNEGPDIIIDYFEVFYSLLSNFHNIDQTQRNISWRIISRSLTRLQSEMENELSDPNYSSLGPERAKQCNVLKMTVYIFCTLAEFFEERETKQRENMNVENMGKGRKKLNKKSDEMYDWMQNKERGVTVLLRLFSLPLHRYFDPPIVEDDFVNVITKCCYKMLENPNLPKSKDAPLVSTLFHILGNAVEKHRQSLSFCLKIIQILQHKEHLVPILAQLVEVIVKRHNQKIILNEPVREIKRIEIRELSRDSSGPRAISKFLEEVAEKCSAEMLPCITELLTFLEEDSYLMRNATLTVIGHLIVKELSKNELDAKEKNLRDQLLDKLEDHILDMTSYTRSRTLQVWHTLCYEEVIPLPRLETLIETIVGRLKDKSCFVRKAAVQFLTQFLMKNPFAAKLPLEVLQFNYKKEEAKLKLLMQEAEKIEQQQMETDLQASQLKNLKWKDIEPDFLQFLEASEEEEMETDESSESSESYGYFEEAAANLKLLMVNRKFKKVVDFLMFMKRKWPEEDVFVEPESDDDSFEDDSEGNKPNKNVKLPYLAEVVKKIFSLHKNEQTVLDLGSKSVEQDIQQAAKVIIQSSQTESTETVIEIPLNSDTLHSQIPKQQILVKYLFDCVKFTEQIQIAIPLVKDLLLSKNVTDVQEAIEFFVIAHKFGVQDAIQGIRAMIVLIWSNEKSIKEAIVSAYRRVYLNNDEEGRNERARAAVVVKSLSELVQGATLGELISLEHLLKEFMESEDIGHNHILIMWERFAMKLPNTTAEESRVAVQLIGMLASSKEELVRSNLSVLIDVGLGKRAYQDSRLAYETSIALSKAFRVPKLESKETFFRLPKTHELFERLSNILISGITQIEDKFWPMLCNESIKMIFKLAENPDYICEQLVRNIIKELLKVTETDSIIIDSQSTNSESQNINPEAPSEQIPSSQNDNSKDTASQDSQNTNTLLENSKKLNSEILARFLTLLGDVALNMLVHLDTSILTELKIRNYLKDEKENKNKTKTPRRRSKTPKTPGSAGGDQNLEEEIGLGGAGAIDDQEQECLNKVCDEEVVLGENLLAKLSSVLVAVARDPVKYPDVRLRTAATLALAKYMAVSHKFCRNQITLLATIMTKSPEPVIRANTVIALGDLCVRFPNILDQWSGYMFQRLRDEDVGVKKCALKVLARLILSDMVKVKGYISEIAVLIVDNDDVLSSSSRLFFTELGKKQNAIYNVLPDLISHLSDKKDGLNEEDFRTVIKFCFDLIDKDRQTVCLVEKLCQRFRATMDDRQWRDLAYCLSLLNYSEKSIQKLNENLVCFADKLSSDAVYDSVIQIIEKARKIPNLKNETKDLINEFEQKVNECHNKGINEDESEFQKIVGTPTSSTKKTKPSQASTAKKAKSVAKTKRKVPQRRRSIRESDEEEETEIRAKPTIATRERPVREHKKRVQIDFSSSDED